jgi:hypothetical protein
VNAALLPRREDGREAIIRAGVTGSGFWTVTLKPLGREGGLLSSLLAQQELGTEFSALTQVFIGGKS